MADLARIKRNVAKMAAQNAPEADIDGYIASEGVTIDDVRNFRPGAEGGKVSGLELLKEFEGEGQPERGIFRRVDDAVRGVADMATFGLSDEISAKLGEWTGIGGEAGNYDANLAAQRQRDSQGGWERLGGQVAGALMIPGGAARSIPKAMGQGAAVGGAYGFGSGEGDLGSRFEGAAYGGAIGGAAGGLVRAGANALGNRAAARSIPTSEGLKRGAEAAYKVAEDAGVIIKPEGVRRLATETVNDLANFGYHPQLQPRIGVVLKEMERLAQGNVTYKGMDVLRKIASSAAKSMDASEQEIAGRIIQRIDDYMGNLPADDVLSGNAAQASESIRKARDSWARYRRSEMVDVAKVKAERRAASTGAGGNQENTLRQNVRGILDNPRRARGMTEAEKAMAERVVRGTSGQNLTRLAGKLAPTGAVSGVLSGAAGYGLAGPVGLALPLAGAGAKAMAERMTTKNVQRLSQIIRSGGKTGKDLARLARAEQLTIPEVKRIEALAKHLGMSAPAMMAVVRERFATSP